MNHTKEFIEVFPSPLLDDKMLSPLQLDDKRTSTTYNESMENIEKLFSQPKELFEAVDFSDFGIMEQIERDVPLFIEGESYSLNGVACDGFEMKPKVYKLVKVVDTFYGEDIQSVIVKQVSGEKGLVFTLSKNDCIYHNIEYENGLQLFPKSLPWKRIKRNVKFDKHNLSTTPLSSIDNTVRYIVIRLDGFKDYRDGYIITPSGHLVTEEHFERTVRVRSNEPIVYRNGFTIRDNAFFDRELVYPKNMVFNHGNFISSDDSIFLMVKLIRGKINGSNGCSSIDGYLGVEPKYFENISPNNLFTISWDEFGANTVQEYEEEKIRKEIEIAERIRRKEEEKKRKKIEENRRIDKAVNRIMSANFMFPKIDSFNSIESYAKEINRMCDDITHTLTEIENELTVRFRL